MRKKTDVMSTSIAVGYTRGSTRAQQLGPAAQEERIQAWGEFNLIPVAVVLQDNITTEVPPLERPKFSELIEVVKTLKADFIVVTSRDRVARDVLHMALLERDLAKFDPPCRIRTATEDPEVEETPERAAMNGVVDVMAAYHRAKIRQTTKEGVRKARQLGHVAGPRPWSTFRRGQLMIQLFKRLKSGGISNAAIVSFCDQHALLSPHRGKITLAHVRSALNSAYPEGDLDQTADVLLAELRTAPYYESKFVPGDDTDRRRARK